MGRDDDIAKRASLLDGMRRRIADLQLDLRGLNVITEAATGIYACTAVIAALAGAERVEAIGKDTRRYGSFEDAVQATSELARQADVADRIVFSRTLDPDVLAKCDILTNSGHLRPITEEMIARLPKSAVIGLMFEAWEFREADLDLAACRRHGIRVAAVNERHPDVGVFRFLGPLCVRLLEQDAAPAGSRAALVCDNLFASFIMQGLTTAKYTAEHFELPRDVPSGKWDAVVIALNPARCPPLGEPEFAHLAEVAKGALLAQFWGDMDRAIARKHGFDRIIPAQEPDKGHMGILLSALGPEPIIRLQAGGLKAAELIRRGQPAYEGSVAELL